MQVLMAALSLTQHLSIKRNMKNSTKLGAAASLFTLIGCTVSAASLATSMSENAAPEAVLVTYANIAHAGYEDSLNTAKTLQDAINAFVSEPTKESMDIARSKWRAARVPYQQTEVYRFGNMIVDDWEGKVNAWPLDEGLIDYVDTSYYGTESDENDLFTANVIANANLMIGGKEIDATNITANLLSEVLQEADEIEANVATGYHAIEFLLWGQDLNGTAAGAGARMASDYDTKNCSNGNCDRRAQYLVAATDLLVSDLAWMTAQWAEAGKARNGLIEGDVNAGLATMLTGMGSLSYGELAGERMKLGVMLHDPEEEHDCFSDNTHNSHYYDAKGIQNIYLGAYTRIDGDVVEGASLSSLVAATSPELDKDLQAKLEATMNKMGELVAAADAGEAYDTMIGEGNDAGNARVLAVVDALVDQTKSIEKAVALLGLTALEVEGSDSLDAPETVQ